MNNKSKQKLGALAIPSVPGNERIAMEQVASMLKAQPLSLKQLEHLKTAVAEATMNAMEHGNKYREDVPVHIYVFAIGTDLVVSVEDQGGNINIPEPLSPNLEAIMAEQQAPRGWGLFLIKNLVDDLSITSDGERHIVKLIMHLQGENNGG